MGEFWLHMSTEPTGMKAPMILSTSLFEFPRVSLEVRGYVFSIFGFCLFVSPPHTWQCILQCVPFYVCGAGALHTDPTPVVQLAKLSVHCKQWCQ